MAALEIKESLRQDRSFYLENWGEELQIRVGISVGSANVGFYGNKKLFKTYTAIGAPLPFASRLTAMALPGQILVDQEIAQTLLNQGFKLNQLGEKNIKGFEKEAHFVYELLSVEFRKLNSEFMKKCPTPPYSLLFLDTNPQGEFLLKCRDCGYEEQTYLNSLTASVLSEQT